MSYGGHERPSRPSKRGRGARLAPEVETRIGGFEEVDVAIVCESTYPFLTGGLSAVVHQICLANPELRIGIIHIAWDLDSPAVDLYEVPPQVRWVKTLHQALSVHADTFQAFRPRDTGLGKRERGELSERIVAAIDAHLGGDDQPLWSLYDDGVNPLTRRFLLWPILGSTSFMMAATRYFASSGLSFTELFWQLREFFSLAYAVTDVVFPKAGVYHAHTTGAAALLAAAAARQQDGVFLLTEHNLYTRDTINHLLHRSMDTVVTVDEWRRLEHYLTAEEVPQPATVTPVQRAWMAWWARTGVVAYRAAKQVTYLYPEAIEEARGLGGVPSRSVVLANGVTPEHFDEARELFRARQERAKDAPAPRIWKLAYAARVVPIKGLLDLLEAMALLRDAGIVDWELDVMGPDGEMPDYAARCRARCTELGLDGQVRFLGSVNLRERFGHYDVLVLPSHNEGQPIVVLEAMTMGLPTVGTYVGGMKQLVEDTLELTTAEGDRLEVGPCGALVDSHDVPGLAREVGDIMREGGRFEEYSRNAQLRVEHYFHIDTAMAQYRELYRELVERAEVAELPAFAAPPSSVAAARAEAKRPA